MKIALIDLNHMTVGVHTNTVPLGIGLIARYLKEHITGEFDIRMFKDPDKFLRILKSWRPDVLGLAQYSWNSELNLYMAGLVKTLNQACFIVAGGPNLHLARDERTDFLKKHNCVDMCVGYDGEIPFAEIIRRLAAGEKAKDIKRQPPAGCYCHDRASGRLAESDVPPPRLKTLDEFGAVYADGLFDDFLDEGFSPFLQTQRGCPFGCIYCHTSDVYYSRMIFQSPEFFRRDLECLGRRFAGQRDVVLYLANTNFGFFKEDFQIAQVIRDIQDKYDWPRNFNVNSGKDPKRLLELLSILKYKFDPVLSLQTLTPEVLKKIKRKNITLADFAVFQKEAVKKASKGTRTELILSLPEETKASFLRTLSAVLNSGVQNIVIYTLMALNGTPISSREYARRYKYDIRYRVVPRCFSEIDGKKVLETEKVIVGTDTMPFKDYLDLRGLSLIITVFASSIELFPIRKFLLEHKLDIARWVFSMHEKINEHPKLYSLYRAFLQETQDELFASREELTEFFSTGQNYKLLCSGRFGDNLLRKYKSLLLSSEYAACLKAALRQLHRVCTENSDLRISSSLLVDLEVFLESRDIGGLFRERRPRMPSRAVLLQYDIPRWLDSGRDECLLEDYKGWFRYTVKIAGSVRRRLKTYVAANRSPELSLQILYRDGTIQDFWPLWVRHE